MHCHHHWEVVYCTSGTGTFVFNDHADIKYGKNEAVAIPPNTMHANLSEKGFTNIYLTFDATSFPFKGPMKIFDNESRHIYSAISSAYYFFNSEIGKSKNNILTSLGELISNYIVAFAGQAPYSESVDRIRNAIISNFSDSAFCLEKAIQNEPHNPDYLRKRFKRETGLSPLAFLTFTKMAFAKKLLGNRLSSDFNINEISEMCGYDDPLYFSRVFKKNVGVSPKNFVAPNNEKK